MKKLIFILIMSPILTFSQNWQWARHIGSNGDYNNWAEVITDGINAYLVGTFSGSLNTINDTLFCIGSNDMFIAKYDQNGNELWVKSFGGANPDGSPEMVNGVFDPDNQCIYLGGAYYGTMNLDSLQPLHSFPNGTDNFILKMDLNGKFIWAKSTGSPGIDFSQIFRKPDGQIVLAGYNGYTAYFDSIKVSQGGFISIFDTNGNCLWARKCFEGLFGSYLQLAFVENDFILTGNFNYPSILIDTIQLTNSGMYDGVIVRLDSSGKVKWYRKIGGKGNEYVIAMQKDEYNHLYLTGYFSDTLIADIDTLYNAVRDYFLLKLDQNGNSIWIDQGHSSGTTDGSYGYDIQINQSGNIYVNGMFSSSAIFNDTLKLSDKESDFFLAKYNSNGDCIGFSHCGKGFGGNIAIDDQGNIFCTISIQDTFHIGNDVFESFGKKRDIVIAKSSPLGTGIQPIAPDNILYIYANPSSGKCTIKIPIEFQKENKLFLCIYDNSGKKIFENMYDPRNEELRINLEFNAKGIYPVTLSNGKNTYRGKIIFQ